MAKTSAILVVIILILNIIYYLAMKKNFVMFWIVIGLCALFAYTILPKMRE